MSSIFFSLYAYWYTNFEEKVLIELWLLQACQMNLMVMGPISVDIIMNTVEEFLDRPWIALLALDHDAMSQLNPCLILLTRGQIC